MSDTPLNEWSKDMGHPKPLESIKIWDRGNYVTVTAPPDARDAEIERLSSELSRLKSLLDFAVEQRDLDGQHLDVVRAEFTKRIDEQDAELSRLRQDAERYRYLASIAERFVGATGATFWEIQPQQGNSLDAAIDAVAEKCVPESDGNRGKNEERSEA